MAHKLRDQQPGSLPLQGKMQLDFLYSLFEMVLITFLVIVTDCLFDKSNLEETSFILGSLSGKVESVMRGETRDLGRLIAGGTEQEPIEYMVWEVRKQRTWGGGLASTHPPNPSPSPAAMHYDMILNVPVRVTNRL